MLSNRLMKVIIPLLKLYHSPTPAVPAVKDGYFLLKENRQSLAK